MPKHITIENDLHDFDSHQIQTLSSAISQVIDVYDTTVHTGATLYVHLNDGVDAVRIRFECIHFGAGTDINQDICYVVNTAPLNISISRAIVSDIFQITITNNSSNAMTGKYYVVSHNL